MATNTQTRPNASTGLRRAKKKGAVTGVGTSLVRAVQSQASSTGWERGRSYAKKGKVSGVSISDWRIEARVAGSESNSYRVFINTTSVGRAGAGELPPVSMVGHCTCPAAAKWSVWCKHIVAVAYVAAAELEYASVAARWLGRELTVTTALGGTRESEGSKEVGGPQEDGYEYPMTAEREAVAVRRSIARGLAESDATNIVTDGPDAQVVEDSPAPTPVAGPAFPTYVIPRPVRVCVAPPTGGPVPFVPAREVQEIRAALGTPIITTNLPAQLAKASEVLAPPPALHGLLGSLSRRRGPYKRTRKHAA